MLLCGGDAWLRAVGGGTCILRVAHVLSGAFGGCLRHVHLLGGAHGVGLEGRRLDRVPHIEAEESQRLRLYSRVGKGAGKHSQGEGMCRGAIRRGDPLMSEVG